MLLVRKKLKFELSVQYKISMKGLAEEMAQLGKGLLHMGQSSHPENPS